MRLKYKITLDDIILYHDISSGAAIFCEIEREQEKAHSEKMKEHWKKFQEVG